MAQSNQVADPANGQNAGFGESAQGQDYPDNDADIFLDTDEIDDDPEEMDEIIMNQAPEEQVFQEFEDIDYNDFDEGEPSDGPPVEVLFPPPQSPFMEQRDYVEIPGETYGYPYPDWGQVIPEDASYNPYYEDSNYYDYGELDGEDTENDAYVAGYDQGYVNLPLNWGQMCAKYGEKEGEGEEEEEPKVDKMEYFLNTVMTIPEQEGIEALDKSADVNNTNVKDNKPSFLGEEEVLKEGYEPADYYVSDTTPVFYRCPSIESFFRQGCTDVYLYLEPGKKMISKEVRLDTTIFQLKEAVSRYAKIHPEMLDLRLNHSLLTNTKTLADLGVKAHAKVRFTVEVNKRMDHHTLLAAGGASALVLKIPELNDVKLPYRPDTARTVTHPGESSFQSKITVVHATDKKPMLGGHKNKITSVVYHDAATNTTSDLEEETGAEKYEPLVGDLICWPGTLEEVPRRLKKRRTLIKVRTVK